MGLGRGVKAVKGDTVLHETSFVFRRDWGCITGTHAPLHVFGDMLTRRTKTRIQSREEKRNCLMSVW